MKTAIEWACRRCKKHYTASAYGMCPHCGRFQ